MKRPPAMRGPTRGRSHKAAERRAAGHWVCLIGFADVLPRYMGDNMGSVPVRIVTAAKDRTAAHKYDAAQPIHKCVVLERVAVDTEEHAKRLKEALDILLLGEAEAQRNDALRKQWVDVRGCYDDEMSRQMWWGIMLDSALALVKRHATRFQVYDGAGVARKVESTRQRGTR